jgi:hypothetical protein
VGTQFCIKERDIRKELIALRPFDFGTDHPILVAPYQVPFKSYHIIFPCCFILSPAYLWFQDRCCSCVQQVVHRKKIEHVLKLIAIDKVRLTKLKRKYLKLLSICAVYAVVSVSTGGKWLQSKGIPHDNLTEGLLMSPHISDPPLNPNNHQLDQSGQRATHKLDHSQNLEADWIMNTSAGSFWRLGLSFLPNWIQALTFS